jgi:hypothetical protein
VSRIRCAAGDSGLSVCSLVVGLIIVINQSPAIFPNWNGCLQRHSLPNHLSKAFSTHRMLRKTDKADNKSTMAATGMAEPKVRRGFAFRQIAGLGHPGPAGAAKGYGGI